MLTKILIKGKQNSIKWMVEMPVTLEKACVALLLIDFCIDQNMKVTQILNTTTKELDQS